MGKERIRLTVLVAVFALTLVGVRVATRHRLEQKRAPDWDVVSYQFEGWSGRDTSFDPLYGSDPAGTSLLRIYSKGHNPPVIAYVGFFDDLPTVLEVHTPEVCYPSQGWNIVSSRKLHGGVFRGKQIPAEEIVAEKLGNRRLIVWWYNAGSRVFETRIRYIFAMLAMSTLTGRTDGSMVRLETPVEPGDEAAANTRIEDFRRSFLLNLETALPR